MQTSTTNVDLKSNEHEIIRLLEEIKSMINGDEVSEDYGGHDEDDLRTVIHTPKYQISDVYSFSSKLFLDYVTNVIHDEEEDKIRPGYRSNGYWDGPNDMLCPYALGDVFELKNEFSRTFDEGPLHLEEIDLAEEVFKPGIYVAYYTPHIGEGDDWYIKLAADTGSISSRFYIVDGKPDEDFKNFELVYSYDREGLIERYRRIGFDELPSRYLNREIESFIVNSTTFYLLESKVSEGKLSPEEALEITYSVFKYLDENRRISRRLSERGQTYYYKGGRITR